MIEYVFRGYTIRINPHYPRRFSPSPRKMNHYWQVWTGTPEQSDLIDQGTCETITDAYDRAERSASNHQSMMARYHAQQVRDTPEGFVSRPDTIWTLESILGEK